MSVLKGNLLLDMALRNLHLNERCDEGISIRFSEISRFGRCRKCDRIAPIYELRKGDYCIYCEVDVDGEIQDR